MRVVLDTNTLVSRLLVPTSVPAQAVRLAVAHDRILASEATLLELADVLGRAKFDRYVTVEERQTFLRLLSRIAERVVTVHVVRACRDPRDDKVLALAANGRAETIVTGDSDLLALHPFRGIPVLTPAAFLASRPDIRGGWMIDRTDMEVACSATQQNIYDDPDFFAGYSQLPRAREGLQAVYEWAAFQRLLPASLEGASVLDLGCGLGYFARWARGQGARHVTAVDLSDNMLRRARSFGDDPGIHYVRSSLEDYRPDAAAFDLVVSMLSVHYVADYPAVVRRVAAALKPGGRFALSVEHPVFSANPTGQWTPEGWPIDGYRDEGPRRRHWFVDGVVRHHRTVETYVNTLLAAGLALVRLEEPEADADFVAVRPDAARERRRPPFLLLAADRGARTA